MSESYPLSRLLISVALSPRTQADRWKLLQALSDLIQQDPAIKVESESGDGSILISGTSDLQLETICARIVQEYEIQLDVGAPQVIYLETICKRAEAEGTYTQPTNGLRQYAHVALRVEPSERGSGYQFVDETTGDTIPSEFVESANAGIQIALKGGVLAGYEMVDLRAVLYDGNYHMTGSSEMAFQIAASMAFKEAARKAAPIILEPIMSVEVVVPEEYLGTIIGDLNRRRWHLANLAPRAESRMVRAIVPLAELFTYGSHIRSITQGTATHSMHFVRYEPAPRRGGPGDYTAAARV